jgi:hypothetical protein
MQSITLEQLRATARAGGVTGVTMKGQGASFILEIATRSGHAAVLSKARSADPRRFGNPASALVVLRNIGIAVAQVDATDWNPDQKQQSQSRKSRADAMRDAHKAAAYTKWLATEVQAAIDDPRPSLSNDEVMADMDAEIAILKRIKRKNA